MDRETQELFRKYLAQGYSRRSAYRLLKTPPKPKPSAEELQSLPSITLSLKYNLTTRRINQLKRALRI